MKVPRLEPIAPRVWLLRGGLTRLMNVYLLEEDDGVVVFDAGEKGMAGAIAAAAARLGGINRVVLGHGDTDHRGSAPELSKVAPVLCHPDAVAQAEGSGGRDYWHMERLPTAIRLLHRFTHRFVWDGGPVKISGTVAPGSGSRASRWSSSPATRRGRSGSGASPTASRWSATPST